MAALGFLLFIFIGTCLVLQAYCQVGSLGPAPSASLSTVWTCRVPDIGGYEQAVDPWLLRPLTTPGHLGLSFGAGFYCISPCETFIFGVYAIYTGDPSLYSDPNEYELVVRGLVVWSANRDRQVRQDATLNFTGDGDLVLRDADGSLVWSSNTSGRSVIGVNMMESGNLVLFDHHNVTVWQSFDYPVDSLLPGQRLLVGQSLTPNMSSINMTVSNQFYFTLRPDGIYAFAGYREPQLYYRNTDTIFGSYMGIGRHTYMTLMNGSLVVANSASGDETQTIYLLQLSQSLQCLRFESNGHLRLYEWMDTQWKVVQDVFELEQCDYPSVCGDYGICFSGQCSCPMASSTSGTYFRQLDDHKPSLGCILDTPISCQSKEDHQLIQVHNVSYFSYIDLTAGVHTDEESCKQACLGNCSCRAALYHYHKTASNGSCLLVSEVLSLQVLSLVGSSPGSAFLKVQIAHPKKRGVLPYTLGGVTAALVLFATVFAILRCTRNEEEANEDEFADLPGMPARFTFQSLQVATKDFSSKIGEGGFGSVFKGVLGDQLVAVKHLHQASQGTKEFLAEVQTIGNLHHINLVRLIGFCAEKAHRLLVYEYMPRGSLDKWIYNGNNKALLDWHTRHKIIANIAKGLSYLHEDCRQRIVHLDIKPQNILLDDNFDAKVADFGLSKLIDRDRSRVVTRMRGTPGYMAPEWLTSQITEKVDVYSFGVVVMEIICGRKNLDYSQPVGSIQLINLLQEKAKNGKLEDMIDMNSEDMQIHMEEVLEMMNLAIWCLQSDSSRRPAISLVVKVMEGERQVETNLEFNFFDLSALNAVPVGEPNLSSLPIASVLSTPR